jgi:hypothetical protein
MSVHKGSMHSPRTARASSRGAPRWSRACVGRSAGPAGRALHPEALLDVPELVVAADHELGRDGGAIGAGGQVGDVSLQPGQIRALASSSRLTLFVAPSRAMNRFRLTGARPATALAACSSMPHSARRARSALNW